MSRNAIESRIIKAFENNTPDILIQVKNAEIIKEETNFFIENEKTRHKKITRNFLYACACFIILISVGVGTYLNNWYVVSLISIDVNPSIEFETNKKEQVLNVKALNAEAKQIIGNMNLKKVDLNVAVNAVIGSMVKNGYVTQENSTILISVLHKDEIQSEQIRMEIVDAISNSLKASNINATIYNQTIEQNEDTLLALEDLAKQHHVSMGKMMFAEKLAKQESLFTAEELAQMSLNDISKLADNSQIDLQNIVHCHKEMMNFEEEEHEEEHKMEVEHYEENNHDMGHHNKGYGHH